MKIKTYLKHSFILGLLLTSINISATTWLVNTEMDDQGNCDQQTCSLRSAISSAVSGDDITIENGLMLSLSNSIIINKNLTVSGLGLNREDVGIVSDNMTVFEVMSSASLTLNNLRIFHSGSQTSLPFSENDPASGVIYNKQGTVSINQVLFEESFNPVVNNNGTLSLNDVRFTNGTWNSGAAILSNGGDITVEDSYFENSYSRAISLVKDFSTPLTMTVKNSIFNSNQSINGFGGAIYAGDSGEVPQSHEEGMFMLSILDSEFTNNYDSAIYISIPVSGSIQRSKFINNSGGNGGAIYLSTVRDFEVSESYFLQNNAAGGRGGAIYSDRLVVNKSTFDNNSSYGNGAAIIFKGNAQIYQSTFVNHRVAGQAGIVGQLNTSVLVEFFHSTFAHNSGNVFYRESQDSWEPIISHSILLGLGECDSSSQMYSYGFNVFDSEACMRNSTADVLVEKGTSIVESNLADNGGNVPTLSLIRHPSNPAIDFDSSPTDSCENFFSDNYDISKDQRDMNRPQGSACDTGAYELDIAQVPNPNELKVQKITNLNHAFQTVGFTEPLSLPVVITGVVTTNGIDAGTIRLKDVTNYGFSIKYQEFDKNRAEGESNYAHNLTESLSVLASNLGIHTLTDGSVIETMKFILGDDDFSGVNTGVYENKRVQFNHGFLNSPLVLCSIQTFNGNQAVFTQVENVDSQGFNISLVEQEFNNQQYSEDSPFHNLYGHQTEEVGCMAITLANNANWATTQKLLVNEQIQDTLFANKIHLQEDISADAEMNIENPARVNLLWVENGYNAHMFGTVEKSQGGTPLEPATLRQCVEGNRGCEILQQSL